eukprot:9151452-Pyramimonas_sp.AAC.1
MILLGCHKILRATTAARSSLLCALHARVRRGINLSVQLGKADSASAFKTLPPLAARRWLYWALARGAGNLRWAGAPLWTRVFGDRGWGRWMVQNSKSSATRH